MVRTRPGLVVLIGMTASTWNDTMVRETFFFPLLSCTAFLINSIRCCICRKNNDTTDTLPIIAFPIYMRWCVNSFIFLIPWAIWAEELCLITHYPLYTFPDLSSKEKKRFFLFRVRNKHIRSSRTLHSQRRERRQREKREIDVTHSIHFEKKKDFFCSYLRVK